MNILEFSKDDLIPWPHRLLGPKIFSDKELIEIVYTFYCSNKTNFKEYINESNKRIATWKSILNTLYSKQARFNILEEAKRMYVAYLKKHQKFNNELNALKANTLINHTRLQELARKLPILYNFDRIGITDKIELEEKTYTPTFQQWKSAEIFKLKQEIKRYNQFILEEQRLIKYNINKLKTLMDEV